MTDRDRLAADLLNVGVEWAHYEGDETWDTWTADRLLALGWTRLDEAGPEHVHVGRWCRACHALDEERLARALSAYFGKSFDYWPAVSGAIAKAYREDTDA